MAFLATELSDKINGYLSEMPYMREPKGCMLLLNMYYRWVESGFVLS